MDILIPIAVKLIKHQVNTILTRKNAFNHVHGETTYIGESIANGRNVIMTSI